MNERDSDPGVIGDHPERYLGGGDRNADALKTPVEPGRNDDPGHGGTLPSRGSSPTPIKHGGRARAATGPPVLPDACEWCGWLAPLLVLVAVTARGRKYTHSWWLCRPCKAKLP